MAATTSESAKVRAGAPGTGRPPAAVTGAGKWVVTFSVLLGTFMSVMDVSVVNVAMPHMKGSFRQTKLSIPLDSPAYLIAEIIKITMSGLWSMIIGRKRYCRVSMLLFTVGKIMCGTSRTFFQIVTERVI